VLTLTSILHLVNVGTVLCTAKHNVCPKKTLKKQKPLWVLLRSCEVVRRKKLGREGMRAALQSVTIDEKAS
jgi:hypothetical protein